MSGVVTISGKNLKYEPPRKRLHEEIMSKPDATLHNPAPDYLRGLLDKAGLSQRKAAHTLGVSERMMRYYLVPADNADYREAPYVVQYALEQLAAEDSPTSSGKERELTKSIKL